MSDDDVSGDVDSDEGAVGSAAEAEVRHAGGATRAAVRATRPPPSVPQAAEARAWLAVAEPALAGGRYEDATAAARAGLVALGTDYLDPAAVTEDDTGMKVLSADTTDDPAQRATLLTRVLAARLQMYAWRHERDGVTFDPPLDA